jgi:hypothetical protein
MSRNFNSATTIDSTYIFTTAIEGCLKRLTNGESVLAVLMASLFWICILIWVDVICAYNSAEKAGRYARIFRGRVIISRDNLRSQPAPATSRVVRTGSAP